MHIPRFPILAASVGLFATHLAFAGDRPITSYEQPFPEFGEIERLDPALDELIDENATMLKLAEGFSWSEGPVWDFAADRLYFSDVPENIAFQWQSEEGVSIFLSPSGFTGETYNGSGPGSNGLAFDLDGNLVLCQHGDRRMARLNQKRRGYLTLAGEFEGKRFNSPNDVCYDSEGNFYFTDPPYGLGPDTPSELDQNGVYRVTPEGEVTLLTTEFERPNGIALSPDEKTLYVANSHDPRPIIMAFSIQDDGSLSEGAVFFDSTELREMGRQGSNDGLKTDVHGNVWATSAGGVVILSPEGKHLGSLLTGRSTANCSFGGNDRQTLFITAHDVLCSISLKVKGYFPERKASD